MLGHHGYVLYVAVRIHISQDPVQKHAACKYIIYRAILYDIAVIGWCTPALKRAQICSSRQQGTFANDHSKTQNAETSTGKLSLTRLSDAEIRVTKQSPQSATPRCQEHGTLPTESASHQREQIQPFSRWATGRLMGKDLHVMIPYLCSFHYISA